MQRYCVSSAGFDFLSLTPSSGTERSLCGATCYNPRVFRCCERTQTNTGTAVLACFSTTKVHCEMNPRQISIGSNGKQRSLDCLLRFSFSQDIKRSQLDIVILLNPNKVL